MWYIFVNDGVWSVVFINENEECWEHFSWNPLGSYYGKPWSTDLWLYRRRRESIIKV